MKIEITGLQELGSTLEGCANRIQNLQPAFERIQKLVIQEFKGNFDTTGRTLESEWQPRKYYYPWPILNKTGKMKGAWEGRSSAKQVEIKNMTDYATYHHFGTPKLPIRKLVGITTKIMQNIIDRLKTYILTSSI